MDSACIYCSRPIDDRQGVGDHIIPARLGEFRQSPKFRRICRKCNGDIGRSEEQLLRCGPERLYRDLVVPATARSRGKRSSWSVGAAGMPPPKILIDWPGGVLLARPGADPMSPEFVDQIVVADEAGNEYPMPLYQSVTAQALKDQVQALVRKHGIKGTFSVRWNCSEKRLEEVRSLADQIYPDAQQVSLPPIEAGHHSADGRIQFKFSDHYFRALAKIAFHYYLATSSRITGQEPAFEAIRSFIRSGGDKDRFFTKQRRFILQLPPGTAPARWGHILAAHESRNLVTGYVALFVGPLGREIDYQVSLGQTSAALVLPDLAWGHTFVYDEKPVSAGTVGEASPVTLTKLLP